MNMIQNLENEIWKPINGYYGLYEISNCGRVKSLPKQWFVGSNGGVYKANEKILSPGTSSNGYLTVTLYKNKVSVSYVIHRLVAKSFISNPENKPQVNHKNANKKDNNVQNLEWCNNSENIKHAYDNKLNYFSDERRENCGKCFRKAVIDKNTGVVYKSLEDAAKINKIPKTTLFRWVSGYSKNKSTFEYL